MPSTPSTTARHTITRRHALQALLGTSAAWAAPMAWAQSARTGQGDGRLVVVFLRGAYDGLSALVPHGDANYYALRPSIALAGACALRPRHRRGPCGGCTQQGLQGVAAGDGVLGGIGCNAWHRSLLARWSRLYLYWKSGLASISPARSAGFSCAMPARVAALR